MPYLHNLIKVLLQAFDNLFKYFRGPSNKPIKNCHMIDKILKIDDVVYNITYNYTINQDFFVISRAKHFD